MFNGDFIEKMMALGIGLGVMKQMPNMFDGCIPNFNQSKDSQPPAINNNSEIVYMAVDGQQIGPLSTDELKKLILNDMLTTETLVWMPGMSQWMPAKSVPNVHKLFLLARCEQKNER